MLSGQHQTQPHISDNDGDDDGDDDGLNQLIAYCPAQLAFILMDGFGLKLVS